LGIFVEQGKHATLATVEKKRSNTFLLDNQHASA